MPKLVKQEVKTFISNLVCETCNEGFMVKDNSSDITISLLTNPPKFKHICDKCGHIEWHTAHYPKLTYVYVNEETPSS